MKMLVPCNHQVVVLYMVVSLILLILLVLLILLTLPGSHIAKKNIDI